MKTDKTTRPLIEQAKRKGWPVHGSIYQRRPDPQHNPAYAQLVEANIKRRQQRPQVEAA